MKEEKRCNICNGLLPDKKRKDTSEECVGHVCIRPQLWNFHPDYQRFHKEPEKETVA